MGLSHIHCLVLSICLVKLKQVHRLSSGPCLPLVGGLVNPWKDWALTLKSMHWRPCCLSLAGVCIYWSEAGVETSLLTQYPSTHSHGLQCFNFPFSKLRNQWDLQDQTCNLRSMNTYCLWKTRSYSTRYQLCHSVKWMWWGFKKKIITVQATLHCLSQLSINKYRYFFL